MRIRVKLPGGGFIRIDRDPMDWDQWCNIFTVLLLVVPLGALVIMFIAAMLLG